MKNNHQWISVHRLRFPSEISALERRFEAPSLPNCWRFCPLQHLGDNGIPTWRSDTWFGLGIYDRRDDTETMLTSAREHLPYLSETVEEWHAILAPIAHWGQVNWRGRVEDGTAIHVASDLPAGPLVVITTAGYNDARSPAQRPRIERFVKGIEEVLDYYGACDGNLRRASTNTVDSRDAFTVTLWRDDEAMNQAAYGAGKHRTLMDISRDGSLFDRSSFTRARIVKSRGSWDGDPFAGPLQAGP